MRQEACARSEMLAAVNQRRLKKTVKKVLARLAGEWAPRITSTLALFAVVALASPLLAQRAELVSKADAVRLFAMSRQQWEEIVDAAVAAGRATRSASSSSG